MKRLYRNILTHNEKYDKTWLLTGLITMSFIVEQKIKGNIYLYEVESYYDKKKKQSRLLS